jgi:hypothetical protein
MMLFCPEVFLEVIRAILEEIQVKLAISQLDPVVQEPN